jgi:hypothetical protein
MQTVTYHLPTFDYNNLILSINNAKFVKVWYNMKLKFYFVESCIKC